MNIEASKSPPVTSGRLASFESRLHIGRLPAIFLFIGGLLALGYTFIVPPFQVADEDRHFFRAYDVSRLKLVAPEQTMVPASFLRLRERYPPILDRIPEHHASFVTGLSQWLRQPLRSESSEPVFNQAGNLYSFVPYLPVAFALATGRLLDLAPLAQIYLGRLFNAAFYLSMFYLALRALPAFRLPMLVVGLTPMSLNLAGSLSADAFTLGVSALLTAYVFRLALDDGLPSVSRRDGIVLLGLTAVLALCKLNVWTGLLPLLIPSRKFGSRKRAFLFAAACVCAGCVVALAWQSLNAGAIEAYRVARAAHGAQVADNLAFLSSHPFRFLSIAASTFASSILAWLWELVGVFGWVTVALPGPLFVVYIALMVASACAADRLTLTGYQRAILACFVFLTVLSIHVLLWVFQTGRQSLSDALVGSVQIAGIQGRYFLPIALPALAVISNRGFRLGVVFLASSLAIVMAINGLALHTLWRAYR